jgi:hypothetical protein
MSIGSVHLCLLVVKQPATSPVYIPKFMYFIKMHNNFKVNLAGLLQIQSIILRCLAARSSPIGRNTACWLEAPINWISSAGDFVHVLYLTMYVFV